MSRYKFKGRDPRHTIVIGWDNPLETFFAQVWDGEPGDDYGVELWIGCEIGEIEDVEELAEIVARRQKQAIEAARPRPPRRGALPMPPTAAPPKPLRVAPKPEISDDPLGALPAVKGSVF